MRLTNSSVVLPKQDRGGVSGSVVSAEVDADANSEDGGLWSASFIQI